MSVEPCKKHPTMNLRQVRRSGKLVLQQQWGCTCTSHAHWKWKDVPTVEDDISGQLKGLNTSERISTLERLGYRK